MHSEAAPGDTGKVCQALLESAGAQSLVEGGLSLDEPWRSRFVELMARRVAVAVPTGGAPTYEQMVAWLSNQELYQEIQTLYRLWTHRA